MVQITLTAGAIPSGMVSGPAASILASPSPLHALIGDPGVRAAAVAMRAVGGGVHYELVLLDEANAPLLAFGRYAEEDIVAEWRRLANSSGLALKIQLPNGAVMTPYPQLGRVLLGPIRRRRRHGLLSHRRPRFLTRRKAARFPLRPQVHREPELAGGEIK